MGRVYIMVWGNGQKGRLRLLAEQNAIPLVFIYRHPWEELDLTILA